jgi:hypothetical protein
MERTITLSISKAREYYLSGNDELKALALSVFKVDELVAVGLPTSVGEFTEKYGSEFLSPCEMNEYKAHAKLRKLRDLYRGCSEREYRERLGYGYQYCIVKLHDHRGESELRISSLNSGYNEFLSFHDYEVAKKFLACFEGLIKKAGDLI